MLTIAIETYVTEKGSVPFDRWFNRLSSGAAAKIQRSIYRMSLGNLSQVKRLKGGIYELKLYFGPGYRVYFGQDGDRLIILLAGGTKQRQSDDIKKAQGYWRDYKVRKKQQFEDN